MLDTIPPIPSSSGSLTSSVVDSNNDQVFMQNAEKIKELYIGISKQKIKIGSYPEALESGSSSMNHPAIVFSIFLKLKNLL